MKATRSRRPIVDHACILTRSQAAGTPTRHAEPTVSHPGQIGTTIIMDALTPAECQASSPGPSLAAAAARHIPQKPFTPPTTMVAPGRTPVSILDNVRRDRRPHSPRGPNLEWRVCSHARGIRRATSPREPSTCPRGLIPAAGSRWDNGGKIHHPLRFDRIGSMIVVTNSKLQPLTEMVVILRSSRALLSSISAGLAPTWWKSPRPGSSNRRTGVQPRHRIDAVIASGCDSDALATGHVLGSYRLLKKLGRGAQGDVWKALRFEPFPGLVALKGLKPALSRSPARMAQFRRAAERGVG